MEVGTLYETHIEKRIIGAFQKSTSLPTIVIIGGIHGNEKAGIIALKNVVQLIEKEKINIKYNFYALSGNIKALKNNVRFNTVDLNRLWTEEIISKITHNNEEFVEDIEEQADIYKTIKNILKINKGRFYFIDLHTTSAKTEPFITISDSLNNRKFASNFSIPIILGIEEFLDGPLLTYINEFGHMALGFEAGQHFDNQSIKNCEAFIWLSLINIGCVNKKVVTDYKYYKELLSKISIKKPFYEIDYRYQINKNEHFQMKKGFLNFDAVAKNDVLAICDGEEVKSPINGYVFMPLYQQQGDDGFFIITKISQLWLKLSIIVRKLKLHHLLRLLPGIQKDKNNDYILIVNPKTATFMAVEIFHLFGYRKQVVKDNKYHFIKRDRKVTPFK
ncbi:MAG: succinylglutamate desuccinylase/aspartoacylase family protein [Flavobacteriaceae bacterium]|nr:succinylglutamate desuccinylase/aspartoacylase family protein [Flavobacteriaceae bacterium]